MGFSKSNHKYHFRIHAALKKWLFCSGKPILQEKNLTCFVISWFTACHYTVLTVLWVFSQYFGFWHAVVFTRDKLYFLSLLRPYHFVPNKKKQIVSRHTSPKLRSNNFVHMYISILNGNYLFSQFDAILFHQRSLSKTDLPKIRKPEQKYIMFMLESAAYPFGFVR